MTGEQKVAAPQGRRRGPKHGAERRAHAGRGGAGRVRWPVAWSGGQANVLEALALRWLIMTRIKKNARARTQTGALFAMSVDSAERVDDKIEQLD